MNYYNPYFGGVSYGSAFPEVAGTTTTRGLFSKIFAGGKFSSFLNGTQKTLNIINQAIPIVKQVSPVMKNAKTMFKVMNEFKRVDTPNQNINYNTSNENNITTSNNIEIEEKIEKTKSNGGPTFFL